LRKKNGAKIQNKNKTIKKDKNMALKNAPKL
jgi:hypothetical protein